MQGIIFYPSDTPRKNNAFNWFSQTFLNIGINVEIHFFEDFHNSPALRQSRPDFVLMRGYDFEISEHFENLGIRVINSAKAMQASRDKLESYRLIKEAGLPTPLTLQVKKEGKILASEPRSFKELCSIFGSDKFILKEAESSKGEGVFLIQDEEEYGIALGNIYTALVQEYVEFSKGRDMRVWVVGDKVVGNVLRYNENSFKSNFSAGGSFKKAELSEEGENLAIAAAKCVGLEISGVDLLFTEEGFTICEVNGNAGFRTAPEGVDIPLEIAKYIRSDIEK